MRFAFGRNWTSFARTALTHERIDEARRHLHELLPPETLAGKSFLDIGFGQGLTLCLAAEAGARVEGIDIDPDNLAALEAVSRQMGRAAPPPARVASILDAGEVARLRSQGGFDIVHSWGVLHHTGAMAEAIANAAALTAPGGLLVLALYRRHWSSPVWRVIKWTYNASPSWGRRAMEAVFVPVIYAAKWCVTGGQMRRRKRGMDFRHDVIDWIGGYPYECASAEDVRARLAEHGFEEVSFRPAPVPTGCNEYVFRRIR